ncbi:TPA: hypothetical protein ACH3X1_002798 [Trebouxia sp. C0004]
MVTGVELPKENIVGAHIASHSKRTDMECLLLIKNFFMMFGMACCGVSQSKLHTKILGSALPLTLQTANKFQGISWQDVDGKCIQFGTSCTRPFKWDFTLHGYLAWDFQLIGSVYQTALMQEAS